MRHPCLLQTRLARRRSCTWRIHPRLPQTCLWPRAPTHRRSTMCRQLQGMGRCMHTLYSIRTAASCTTSYLR